MIGVLFKNTLTFKTEVFLATNYWYFNQIF